MSHIIQPKAMTLEEQEADVIATELAAEQELQAMSGEETPADQSVAQATPPAEPTPAPAPEEPPKVEAAPEVKDVPAPVVPEVSPEVEALKRDLAERDQRLAELTKRLRDEDGRRGGELSELRSQIRELTEKITAPVVPVAPDLPPEPDALETEFPNVAQGVATRIRPALETAKSAEATAKAVQAEIAKMRAEQAELARGAFIEKVRTAVPKSTEYDGDDTFVKWSNERIPGTPYTRQAVFDQCIKSLNADPAIELYQQWESERNKKATPPAAPTVQGLPKPTKESQVSVPTSAATATKAKPIDIPKRIKELEDKNFKHKALSAAEAIEYNNLLDLQERGNAA